jgi:hypothetical protein
MDLGRVRMQASALDTFVERFAISLKKTGNTSGDLILEWEKTSVSVPFQLKRP